MKNISENLFLRGMNILGVMHTPGYRGLKLAFSPWMLTEKHGVGFGITYNTPVSLYAFAMALANSKHPLVEDKIKDIPTVPDSQKIFAAFVDNHVMEGRRVLDLGCGLVPMAARALREMGATVYTVDLESADKFEVDDEYRDSHFAKIERAHHIVVDYCAPNADKRVFDVSGGNFDFISNAQTYEFYSDYAMDDRASPARYFLTTLLRTEGVYYDANRSKLHTRQSILDSLWPEKPYAIGHSKPDAKFALVA